MSKRFYRIIRDFPGENLPAWAWHAMATAFDHDCAALAQTPVYSVMGPDHTAKSTRFGGQII